MGYRKNMGTQLKKLVGLREQPMGSNNAPPVTSSYGLKAAWCEMTQWYAAWKSNNVNAIFGKYAYTVAHAAEYKRRGCWEYAPGDPKPGYNIYFQWEGGGKAISKIDHVGWVYWVHAGHVYTIEGNRGDMCKRMKYPLNSPYITGYGRPKFKAAGGTKPPAPTPAKKGKPKYPGTVLKVKHPYMGGRGSGCGYVQAELNRRGYKPKLNVDRVYGPATAAQVKKFQKQHKLTADSEVGPRTWAALF